MFKIVFSLRVPSPKTLIDRAYFDIETIKTQAPADWPYRQRWMTVMVSYAYVEEGELVLECAVGSEPEIIAHCQKIFQGRIATYAAGYRDFDRHVLQGRFTNARRALNSVPGSWAHVDDTVEWENLYDKDHRGYFDEQEFHRGSDIESRLIPDRLWFLSSNLVTETVSWVDNYAANIVVHCIRDTIEVVMMDYDNRLSDLAYSIMVQIYEGSIF